VSVSFLTPLVLLVTEDSSSYKPGADNGHDVTDKEKDRSDETLLPPPKRLKTDIASPSDDLTICQQQDMNRTGAKCVIGEAPDPDHREAKTTEVDYREAKTTPLAYHRTGPLRTKPGRGDRTLSLSCSDKILKWSQIGCQV
jgi:tRNA-specific adenosine deaminase 1